MDKRGVAGTLFGVLAAGGIAALIGATAVPNSTYFDILLWAGIAAIAIGFVGLFALFLMPNKEKRSGKTVDESVSSHGQSGGVTARNVNAPDAE